MSLHLHWFSVKHLTPSATLPDTIRHATLLDKTAQLQIPDAVYNWLVDFSDGHEHCTTFGGTKSSMQSITASVIQGSVIWPASYVVNAADLARCTVFISNLIHKVRGHKSKAKPRQDAGNHHYPSSNGKEKPLH